MTQQYGCLPDSHLGSAIVDLVRASKESIIAEYERRQLVSPTHAKAIQNGRAEHIKVGIREIEDINDDLRRAKRTLIADLDQQASIAAEWRKRAEAAEAKLGDRQLGEQPKMADLVTAVAARVDADDNNGACDVIDAQLFQERLADVNALRGGRKLAADIRGAIVAALKRESSTFGPSPVEALLSRQLAERGPGIAAMPKPDTSHYVDPWDFLEDE